MATNPFIESIQNASITNMESVLGKGLNVPNNATSSGARKILASIHQSHSLVLSRAEMPYVGTGYENRFGDLSSSILETSDDMEVLAKIPKFSYAPNHHYYLILKNLSTNEIDCEERISYRYITEMYGYLHNNSVMDMYSVPGSVIPKGTIIRRSTGFDQYGNKTNGCNINVVYMSLDNNMEDSVVISEECSRKLSSPLIRSVSIVLNENDIPLNIYGDDSVYKVYPDIGEDTKNGILLVYRREKTEESIYTQSVRRLQEIMMSDEKISIKGKVIDINLYCNNPEHIAQSTYNQQFYAYYQDKLRMDQEIVNVVGPYITQGYKLSYDMSKLFSRSMDELEGKKYKSKKQFSNITIEFIVMEDRILEIGDKLVDRYGGKGVVSKILPASLMPRMSNGMPIEMIKNSSTMYNRENAGQIFELEINYISMRILDRIRDECMNPELALEYILKFVQLQSPIQYEAMKKYTASLDGDQLNLFIDSILSHRCIHVSNSPISETMDIDKLGILYQAFPWIQQSYLQVPIKGSNGQIRYVNSRIPIIAAPQYYLRLKQFAEEKFSSASLSSINLKSENTKNKASKNHREPHSNTPIKFGHMESGDLGHMGTEYVVLNLLLHSLSPHARRLVEQMATGDPYNVDIKIDSKSKNRSAEILNTRLKTMGYRMVFSKIPINNMVDQLHTKYALGRMPLFNFQDNDYDYNHFYQTRDDMDKMQNQNSYQNLIQYQDNGYDYVHFYTTRDLIENMKDTSEYSDLLTHI